MKTPTQVFRFTSSSSKNMEIMYGATVWVAEATTALESGLNPQRVHINILCFKPLRGKILTQDINNFLKFSFT